MCEKCEGVLSMRIRGHNQAISKQPRARRQERDGRETRAMKSGGGGHATTRVEAGGEDGGGRGESGGKGQRGQRRRGRGGERG